MANRLVEELPLSHIALAIAVTLHGGEVILPAIGSLEVLLGGGESRRLALLDGSTRILHQLPLIFLRLVHTLIERLEVFHLVVVLRLHLGDSWQLVLIGRVAHAELLCMLLRLLAKILSIEGMHLLVVLRISHVEAIIPAFFAAWFQCSGITVDVALADDHLLAVRSRVNRLIGLHTVRHLQLFLTICVSTDTYLLHVLARFRGAL